MNSRPPPLRPSDRPPTYRMVTRVYNNSLRPIVIVMGSIVAIWSLIWAIGSFKDINEDKENGQPKFATFDLVFGIIYTTACVIEVFGIVAAASQRLAFIRIYAMLSIVASVAVVGAGFLRVVLHFVFKNGLLEECEKVAQGQGIEFRFGIWGPRVKDRLDHDEAVQFCKNAWNRDSLDEILFLIFEIIFSIFFTVLAFAYYHQVRDPTSAANVSRTPAAGPAPYPDHYNRPYDAEGYNPTYAQPYGAGNQGFEPMYAPPPGPPPGIEAGYGVGMGTKSRDVKDDNESDVTKFDDPFADFEGTSKPKQVHDD